MSTLNNVFELYRQKWGPSIRHRMNQTYKQMGMRWDMYIYDNKRLLRIDNDVLRVFSLSKERLNSEQIEAIKQFIKQKGR